MKIAATGHRQIGNEYIVPGHDHFDVMIDIIHEGFNCHGIPSYDGDVEIISGMAIGWDLLIAAAVLKYEHRHKIKLHCVLPFKTQAEIWPRANKQWHRSILERADTVTCLDNRESRLSFATISELLKRRNSFMVDRADRIFSCWNHVREGGTWDALEKAIKAQKQIINLNATNGNFEFFNMVVWKFKIK